MADEAPPPWDALPHDPQRFFGLPDGYDRRDLKRGYNRLIRQFKPDRHPAEFQQIRSAYEQLENYLRYQIESPEGRAVETAPAWEPVGGGSNADSPDLGNAAGTASRPVWFPTPEPHRPDLSERVLLESLELLYEELRGSEQKSPFDYYALAVLEDAQAAPPALGLLRWLLQGLRKFPHDQGLTALVVQLLRDESLPTEQIPAILHAVACAVPSDRFYYLTEPLWDRALRSRPFAKFSQLLSECEAHLHDHEVAGRVIFYLHLLRPAMWTASPGWLAEKFAFLEEHYSLLPPFLEGDLECLVQLRNYVDQRSSFLNGDPTRTALDNVLRAYGEQPDFEAERVFIDCQVRIASGELNLLQALPSQADEACGALIRAWVWMDADMSNRFGDRTAERNETEIAVNRSVRAFLHIQNLRTRCHLKSWGLNRLNGTYQGLCWITGIAIYFIVAAISLIYFILIAIHAIPIIIPGGGRGRVSDAFGFLAMMVWFIGSPLGAWWLSRRFTSPFWLKQCNRLHAKWSRQLYDAVWRPDLCAFLRERHLSLDRLQIAIVAVESSSGPSGQHILRLMGNDVAVRLTASSVRYLA